MVMLPTTSAISPSTAAARSANAWCRGLPAAARRNMKTTTSPATTTRVAAIPQLTAATKPMAQIVARHGGSTFHTSMFSTVNKALDVAVMRLVSVPGERLAK